MKTATVTAPSHWASYLINGDATGFDYLNTPTSKAGDEDFAKCREFEQWCGGPIVGCSDESSFRHRHDASRFGVLAADCLEYLVMLPESDS